MAKHTALAERQHPRNEPSREKTHDQRNGNHSGEIPDLTIGLDLSDRTFQYCELDRRAVIVDEGQHPLTRTALRRYLSAKPAARVALETGGHSAWVKQAAEECGHQAIVRMRANCARSPGVCIALILTMPTLLFLSKATLSFVK